MGVSLIIIIIIVIIVLVKYRNYFLRKLRSWRIERGERAEENVRLNLRGVNQDLINHNRDISENRILRLRCFQALNEDAGSDEDDRV